MAAIILKGKPYVTSSKTVSGQVNSCRIQQNQFKCQFLLVKYFLQLLQNSFSSFNGYPPSASRK
jgi:hypothetical protein